MKETNIDVKNHKGAFPERNRKMLLLEPRGYIHHLEYNIPSQSIQLYELLTIKRMIENRKYGRMSFLNFSFSLTGRMVQKPLAT